MYNRYFGDIIRYLPYLSNKQIRVLILQMVNIYKEIDSEISKERQRDAFMLKVYIKNKLVITLKGGKCIFEHRNGG